MRASKLVNLGSMILMLVAGTAALAEEAPVAPTETPALAEEAPAPAETPALAEEPPATPAEPPAQAEEAPAAPAEPSATPAQPEAATAGAEVASETTPPAEVEPASPIPAEPWAAETVPPAAMAEAAPPATEAVPGEAAAPEVEASAEEAAETQQQLGSIGYDSQGRPGRIHVVVPRDTLWDISDAYLGTPWVWPSIWQDNREIENPHLIHPGDRIWITPSEMRRISAEEAAALLAGKPAALDEGAGAGPDPEVVAPAPQIVPEERPTHYVSDREKVGLIGADTVEASASIVSAAVPRVLLSQGDRVWVGLGEDAVEAGDQLTIFRVQEKVYDPETGRMLGYHVHILGWLEITETDAETSLAVIGESTIDIMKGDLLMARKPPVREITIQASPEQVDGQISFLAEHRTLVGMMEYVYLNRGTLDGLEVGSPLEVYRKGYPAREEVRGARVQVPDRVVADLLVVKAQPEASVALIRHTEEELELGDHFRGARK
jgi:hypothetical protein